MRAVDSKEASEAFQEAQGWQTRDDTGARLGLCLSWIILSQSC